MSSHAIPSPAPGDRDIFQYFREITKPQALRKVNRLEVCGAILLGLTLLASCTLFILSKRHIISLKDLSKLEKTCIIVTLSATTGSGAILEGRSLYLYKKLQEQEEAILHPNFYNFYENSPENSYAALPFPAGSKPLLPVL